MFSFFSIRFTFILTEFYLDPPVEFKKSYRPWFKTQWGRSLSSFRYCFLERQSRCCLHWCWCVVWFYWLLERSWSLDLNTSTVLRAHIWPRATTASLFGITVEVSRFGFLWHSQKSGWLKFMYTCWMSTKTYAGKILPIFTQKPVTFYIWYAYFIIFCCRNFQTNQNAFVVEINSAAYGCKRLHD